MKRLNICFFKSCIVLLILLGADVEAFAYDFYVDGVFYKINPGTTTVKVTDGGHSGSYYGRVDIPSSVTYGSINYSVTEIEYYTFYWCTELSYVSIPNTVTTIGLGAFEYSGIDSISIPNSVKSIGSCAFWRCKNLKKITISDSITSIESSTFLECTQLTEFRIPEAVTYIGDGAFEGCSGLTSITIPNAVESIGEQAFAGCPLTDLTLSNSIRTIGNKSFAGCPLTELIIPSTIRSIGKEAFVGCSLLNWVIIMSASPFSTHKDMFPSNQLIYVPNANRYLSYGVGNEWNKYNIKSIYNNTPQITRSNVFSDNVFDLKSASLKDDNGQIIKTFSSQNNSLIIEDLEPNTNYNVRISVLFNENEFEIDDFFTTNPISVGHLWSKESKLTILLTTFKVNRDDGVYLDSCGVEMNYGTIFMGSITETSDESFTIDCEITGLSPNKTYNLRPWVTYKGVRIYGDLVNIKTTSVSFTQYVISSKTQTTLTPSFCVNRDDGFILEACGVESSSDTYAGAVIEESDDIYKIQCTISGLIPNNSYMLRPWVQADGKKYYGDNHTYQTSPVDVYNEVIVTPTSVNLTGSFSSGDAIVTNAYFTINGEKCESIYQTGLNPNSYYNYTYTIETTSGNQLTNDYFYTPSLSMVAQPVRMLTNTTVMFEAQTNMIDEETIVGFEWRRYDAPDEMPSTKVYSPVFGGKIAGTLKNLAENVYYKYRPFYTSNSGKSYYGNWVAFLTADAGVVYEPIVYTYNSPAVTQTEATLQGVALRGSEDITEQGFEYWKSGNGNVTKVTATGERMSKKVSGLQSGSKYIFRAFLTAGGETHYGNEVEFVTLSNSLDVNIDGEINIADINAVIDMILTDNQVSSGDVNGDGEVNIADINTIIDAILSN